MHLVVIGSGVVGLWVAYLASNNGFDVTVIEKNIGPGSSTSRRNSGVLHAGIYYEPGSNKAHHCVEGYSQTLNFLKKFNVPYKLCGKYIIPVEDDKEKIDNNEALQQLELLQQRAQHNGVQEVFIEKISDKFPYLNANMALYSKKTGVVKIDHYVDTLYHQCCKNKVTFMFGRECVGFDGKVLDLRHTNDSKYTRLTANAIVNAAGLYADTVAELFGLQGYSIRPNKGLFFKLKRPLPDHMLVYPLPFKNSTHLGCHYTVDVDGNAFIGPNAQWADNKEDYQINADKNYFFRSLKKLTDYYQLNDLNLVNRVGLRARLFKDEKPLNDFIIVKNHASVVHLLGIESPGFTSAPSLAQHVIKLIEMEILCSQ